MITKNRFERFKTAQEIAFLNYEKSADSTGGDEDFIIVDHVNKQWIFCENGFGPFCDMSEMSKYNDNLQENLLRHLDLNRS